MAGLRSACAPRAGSPNARQSGSQLSRVAQRRSCTVRSCTVRVLVPRTVRRSRQQLSTAGSWLERRKWHVVPHVLEIPYSTESSRARVALMVGPALPWAGRPSAQTRLQVRYRGQGQAVRAAWGVLYLGPGQGMITQALSKPRPEDHPALIRPGVP